MREHCDIMILGGGVIGLTTAYFLARDGARVAVLDKGDFGQESSWAGAGILPADSAGHSPLDRLRALSVAQFQGLSAELREFTGVDNGYLRSGGLEFTKSIGEAAAEEWHGEGEYSLLDETDLAKLEPALAKNVGQAYHLPDMAQLRNPRHLKALLAGCGMRGVRLMPGCPAQGFTTNGKRITAVKTLDGTLTADRFLLALGAWTDPLLEPLGWKPGIRPIRGQIVLLNPGLPAFRHILLWGSRYLVPRPDGRILIGATEEDVGFDKRTTAGAVADLIHLATTLVPGLAGAAVERCWAGLRPGSPDGLPFLGPVPGWENVFVAAGHFRAGIQLSPGTATLMKESLLGQPLSFSLEPFRLNR
jgi:glycine oxidase